MAGENDIGFNVIALIGSLQQSMDAASSAVVGFAQTSTKAIESVGEAFESVQGLMLGFAGIIAGGVIFKDVIEGTEKWTDSIRSLSKQFGITTEEASGLATALRTIGSSTEEYASAATKLDRQVKSNEDNVNALGVATRDSGGNLLSQQQIMLNAISTLNQYEEGTNRNIAAQFLFGRGAGDLQKLLRLTSDEIAAGSDNARAFGLVVSGEAADGGLVFQESINKLRLSMTGMQIALGEKIIPTLTTLANVFTQTIVPAIGAAIDKTKEWTQALGALYAFLATGGDQAKWDAVADQIAEDKNGTGSRKSEPAAAASSGTKTIPEGFGKDKENSDADAAEKEQEAIEKEGLDNTLAIARLKYQGKKDLLDQEVAAGQIRKVNGYRVV